MAVAVLTFAGVEARGRMKQSERSRLDPRRSMPVTASGLDSRHRQPEQAEEEAAVHHAGLEGDNC